MKVRLYRGPFNGKVMVVPPNRTDIVMASMNKLPSFSAYKDYYDAVTPVPVTHSRYVMTRYAHPDGSIFFEWDQPRKSTKRKD